MIVKILRMEFKKLHYHHYRKSISAYNIESPKRWRHHVRLYTTSLTREWKKKRNWTGISRDRAFRRYAISIAIVITKIAIKSDPETIGTSRSFNNIENIIDNQTGTIKHNKASSTVSDYQNQLSVQVNR